MSQCIRCGRRIDESLNHMCGEPDLSAARDAVVEAAEAWEAEWSSVGVERKPVPAAQRLIDAVRSYRALQKPEPPAEGWYWVKVDGDWEPTGFDGKTALQSWQTLGPRIPEPKE